MSRRSSQTNPSANQARPSPGRRSRARSSSDAGRLQFARLSQARAKRHSRFDEVRRRLERPPESGDRLLAGGRSPAEPRPIARGPSDRPKIPPRAQRRPRLSSRGLLLRSASPISRQPSTKFGKRSSRSSRTDRAFSSPDSMSVTQVRKAASGRSGARRRGALEPQFAPARRSPAARAARAATINVGNDRGASSGWNWPSARRPRGARAEARSSPPVDAPPGLVAPARRIRLAKTRRAFDPAGAELRQSVLKRGSSARLRLRHRILAVRARSPSPNYSIVHA